MPDDFFNTTGAGLNRTRSYYSSTNSTPKKKPTFKPSPKKSEHGPESGSSLPLSPLQLDLENFDDPRYEGSRYVLTSPRSLDACSKLGLKPVDLLYKNLQEYEEEHPGWSVREIFDLYETKEEKRREHLKQARLMRNRIIEEETLKKEEAALMSKKSKSPSSKSNIHSSPGSGKNGIPPKKPSKRPPSKSGITSPAPSNRQRSILKRSSSFSNVNGNPTRLSIDRSVSFENLTAATPTYAASETGSTSSTARRQKAERDALLERIQKLSNVEDRKRLELMIKKQEDDIQLNDHRREAQVQREDELAQERFQREIQDTAYRRQVAVTDHHWRQRNNEIRKELEEVEKDEMEKLKQNIQEKEEVHQRLLENQRREQERLIWERKREGEKRRGKVINNLAEAEFQLAQYQDSIRSHSDETIQRSALRKMQQEVSYQKRKQLENIMKQEAFRYRKFQMERQKELQVDDIRRTIDIRDSVVDMNQRKLARESQILKETSVRTREQKKNAAKERRSQLDSEREEYQRRLLEYKEQALKRAGDRVEGKNTEAAGRLQMELSQKSEQHRQKLEEIRRVEEEWKAETASLLQQKESRVRMLEMEKETRARETRETVYAAERLREEIRKAYEVDSFDRKLNHVNLVNKMGLGGSAQLA